MTTFAYQARDGSGQLTTGTIEATNPSEAGRQLRADGKFVVRLDEAADRPGDRAGTLEDRSSRVKRDEVIYFAHQLAVMIETGVTIGEALDSIAEQTTNEHFRALINDVSARVQAGSSFSEALAAHPQVFPTLMVSLLKASEASGTMGEMLERISAYLTEERNTIKKIKGAMVYPTVMMIVALGVTVFLLTFVLPRFGKIYTTRGAVLPLPTRLLLGISEMVTTYWYAFTGGIVAMVAGFLWFKRIPTGRRWIDYAKLRLPIIGGMFNQLYITRSMRTMSTMISSGVPMLEMIAITRQITHNVFYEELWAEVDQRVQQGAQLSAALFDSPLIPSSIARMVHSGEKAGRLGNVMHRIADFTEHDFNESVKRTTEFIEPAMVAFMGALIGFVAISLLLPIFSVGKVMAGG